MIEIYKMEVKSLHGIINILKNLKNFQPENIAIVNSILYADSSLGQARIEVDLANILKRSTDVAGSDNTDAKLNMAFKYLPERIDGFYALAGQNDITIGFNLFEGVYYIAGEHSNEIVNGFFSPQLDDLRPYNFISVGSTISNFDEQKLKSYVQKKNKVKILVYGDQVEQIQVQGKQAYTFTNGMMEELAGKTPDMVFTSHIAFRLLKGQPKISLHVENAIYFIKVACTIDQKTFMTVYERLTIT